MSHRWASALELRRYARALAALVVASVLAWPVPGFAMPSQPRATNVYALPLTWTRGWYGKARSQWSGE
jgi:hypothetical protein